MEGIKLKSSKQKKSLKNKSIVNYEMDLANKLRNLNQLPVKTIRQLCYPSATAFSITGTGASYTAASGLLNTGAAATNFWTCYFRLSDLPNVSELTTRWDQYKICLVRFHLVPLQVVNTTSQTGNSVIFGAIDFDDSSALSAITDIFQYENCKIVAPYKPLVLEFEPRIAVPTGSGFENRQSGWIDCNDGTVQHYGCKGVIPIEPQAAFYTVVVEYVVQMRSVR